MATLKIDRSGNVDLDEDVLEWYLNSTDGPVGVLMQELALQMARTVTALAPVLKPWNLWSPVTSSAVSKTPGNLRRSVHAKVGHSRRGKLYGGVNAIVYPTMFLEDPARQLHMEVPFMTAALWTVPAEIFI